MTPWWRPDRTLLPDDARSGSGPAVARLFLRGLAGVHLVAWVSLGAQVRVLIGDDGLVPWAPYAAALAARGVSFWDYPSVLRWAPSSTGWLWGWAWRSRSGGCAAGSCGRRWR